MIFISDFPFNIDPLIYSISGAVIAAIIEGDYDSYELNSIGNWLELVGQFLLTSAAQKQLQNNRRNKRVISNEDQIRLLIKYLKDLEDQLKK